MSIENFNRSGHDRHDHNQNNNLMVPFFSKSTQIDLSISNPFLTLKKINKKLVY